MVFLAAILAAIFNFAKISKLASTFEPNMINRQTIPFSAYILLKEAKEKYRGVFEIQKSWDKTSSGEIGLDIRTHASPKMDSLEC